MRDLGYRFSWYDTHCDNIFSRGFGGSLSGSERYDVITAFEVLEHLLDPRPVLDLIVSSCDSFIFSTELLPKPNFRLLINGGITDTEHGQHISYFTASSLDLFARRHKKRYVTNGSDLHMITSKRISYVLAFRFFTRPRVSGTFELLFRRPSLLMSDFHSCRARALAKTDHCNRIGMINEFLSIAFSIGGAGNLWIGLDHSHQSRISAAQRIASAHC